MTPPDDTETPRTDAFVTKWRGADPQRAVEAATEEMKALERENAALRAELADETKAADVMDNAINGEGGWQEIAIQRKRERDQWRAAAEALAEDSEDCRDLLRECYNVASIAEDSGDLHHRALYAVKAMIEEKTPKALALAAFREAGKKLE